MFLQKAVASGGSNLARLGELGGKHLLPFPINRGRREEQKCSTVLKISEKNCFREENPSQGASVTFPWVISRRFSIVLRLSSFVLQSSTGKFPKSNFSIHSMYP